MCVLTCVEVHMCAFSCRDPQFALGDSSCIVVAPLVLGIRGFQLNPALTDSTVLARQLAGGTGIIRRLLYL